MTSLIFRKNCAPGPKHFFGVVKSFSVITLERFGKEGGKFLAEEYNLNFLGQIPLIQSIREGGDEGIPAMIGNDEISKEAFREVTAKVVRNISMRNANLPATKIVEVVR